MDALLPALVAALLAGVGDRPAALAAMLARRGRHASVLAGALTAQVAMAILAASSASMIAQRMTPNAHGLVLAVALLAAGIGALVPPKPPTTNGHSQRSPFLAASGGTIMLGITERTTFLTFAFALRGSTPALTATGAVLGTGALTAGAVILAADWRRIASRPVVVAAGFLLVATGLIVGAGALRLV